MSTDAIESVRLVDELVGRRHPRVCSRCDGPRSARELDRFRYLEKDDDSDRPRAIVLCERCAADLQSDVRLEWQFQELVDNKPYPGTLELCNGCAYLDGLDCRSPLAAMNGGPGIRIDASATAVWVETRGPLGKRIKLLRETWSKATGCDGRRAVKAT